MQMRYIQEQSQQIILLGLKLFYGVWTFPVGVFCPEIADPAASVITF